MKFDENLAAVHAYLCADGYVIKNPSTQKLRYYKIGFRNTNLDLLKDFQERFFLYFSIMPHLRVGQRCEKGSKEIYKKLTKQFGSFYSKDWKMPKIPSSLLKIWLRAYFDCEGWVFCKRHQNRHIGADSINELGLDQVKKELERIGIKVSKKYLKNRNIWRIFIYGKDNLHKFKEEIGFLHPEKEAKLEEALSDFVDYNWKLEKDEKKIRSFMHQKTRVNKPYLIRIFSREKNNLILLKEYLSYLFNIDFDAIKVGERFNGIGTRYFELNINKKIEVNKLIKYNLINPQELNKINIDLLKCIKKN